MFGLFKILSGAIALAMLAGLIIYFLPKEIKISAIQQITDFAPESFKTKAEEILLTPPEKRAKIISKLENNLSELRELNATPKIETLVKNSQDLVEELKKKNEAASIAEILTNKLADKLIGIEKKDLPACIN